MAQESTNSYEVPDEGDGPDAPPVTLKPAAADAGPIKLRAPGNPFLTRGNLVMLAMFGVGILGLYVLKLRSAPSTALASHSLAHAKVEAALDVLAATPSEGDLKRKSTAKAIVAEFYTAARQRQVDARDLRGNPFVFKGIRPPATQPVKPKPKPKPKKTVPDGYVRAMAAVKTLRLQSILVGTQPNAEPVAMISNNLVATGQVIEGWTVTRITAQEVELSWQDKTYVLTMQ